MTTRLTWLLGGLALVALAAACGDDGGNNPINPCGDGTRGGSEQCDDGNTLDGDGCSATCQIEGGPACGDMVVDAGETCDDGNTTDGDGCSATCQTEAPPEDCGNGTIDAGETCDDGNMTAADGCSPTCTVEDGFVCVGEPSACGVPSGACATPFVVALTNNAGVLTGTGSGDTTGGSNQVGEASCDGSLSGGGNDHIYQFTLTDRRDVEIEIADSSEFDAVLRVMTSPCDLATELPEFGPADGCSDYTLSNEFLAYVALPPGTYYIVIDGYDAAELGAYSFTVTARPTECGDGSLDDTEYEFCDDGNSASGDGCDARCEVEPGYACDDAEPSVCVKSCGNGTLEVGEECEDGNNIDGDRCSATCTLEYDVLEVEPNDTTAQVLTAGSHIIKGALTAGDVDRYTFTLTTEATVELETYNRMNNLADYGGVGTLTNVDCYNSLDTTIGLADATTTLFSDDDDGDQLCSYLGPNDDDGDTTEGVLQPGTYTIEVALVEPTATAALYILDLKVTPVITAPVPPVLGDLVLNEFMAADNMSDTNCDNSTASTADEFIELVNVSSKNLDLSGVTISDSLIVRHVFAAGSSVLPGQAIVVWGGGSPACPGVTNFAVASTDQLGLNDGGDTITVATGGAAPVQLLQYIYPTATPNVSFNRSPDVMGSTFVLHNAVPGAVGDWSPGKRANKTAF